MTKIIVTQDEDGYAAYPEGREELRTVGGATTDEAIGTLVRSCPDLFQVSLEYDLNNPRE